MKTKKLTVKVQGVIIDISGSPSITGAENSCGVYRPLISQIILDTSLKKDRQGEVLVHEIFEVIRNLQCMQINHNEMSALTTAFHQVLVDNPKLFGKIILGKPILE